MKSWHIILILILCILCFLTGRYMKNADLLCKQLSDLEGRQNAILDEAREQAEREREKARQDAADIIGEARKTAERLLKDAQENKENAIEEAKKIHEDSLRKVEEEKKQCDELSAQKAAMVNSLKKLTEDTARLMEKMRDSYIIYEIGQKTLKREYIIYL